MLDMLSTMVVVRRAESECVAIAAVARVQLVLAKEAAEAHGQGSFSTKTEPTTKR